MSSLLAVKLLTQCTTILQYKNWTSVVYFSHSLAGLLKFSSLNASTDVMLLLHLWEK